LCAILRGEAMLTRTVGEVKPRGYGSYK
jgi:hypothetical protein